jgi:uncharacterized membrane protein YbhN (UPF0104 family)
MTKKSGSSVLRSFPKGRLLILLILLLFLYVVVPRMGSFRESFSVVGDARMLPLLLSGVFLTLTFVISGLIYWLLALRPIRYGRIFSVQMASALTNRVLPAGVGGPALIVQYLRRNGFRLPEALAMVSANAILGWLGHGLLLAAGLLVSGTDALPSNVLPWATIGIIVLVILGILLVLGLILPDLRHRSIRFLRDTLRALTAYRRRPGRLFLALGLACALTLCYVTMFYLSAQSLGVELSFVRCFLIFTAGIITGSAIPLPGGLVGVEAGLAGGMIVYGADPVQAVAVALLYRLITFGLPLIPAFAAFMTTRKWYV